MSRMKNLEYVTLVAAVLVILHALVETRSFKKEKDILSSSKDDSDLSFIHNFLGLAHPHDEENRTESDQNKNLHNTTSTVENDFVNEREDKIHWTDGELYQLKQNEVRIQNENDKTRNQVYSKQEQLGASHQQASIKQVKTNEGDSDKAVAAWSELEPPSDRREGKESEEVTLTPATDRQQRVQLSAALLAERYTELVQALPGRLEAAREVIVRSVATKNMMGYTFVAAYIIGAILDTVAILLLYPNSLAHALTLVLTDSWSKSSLHWIWWYAFGFSGPWMFPRTFNGGDPDIRAGSEQYFTLLSDLDLTLNIQSFTEKSPAAALILSEKFRREFETRLGPIVNKRGEYLEAELVQQTFNEMLSLVSYHSKLSPGPPATTTDLDLLDSELQSLWREIRDLVVDTHSEVSARRAETAAIYIFIALLNIGGMLGGVFLAVAKVHEEMGKLSEDEKDKDHYEKLTDVANWLFMDHHPSVHVKELGGAALILANLGWGYSYSFIYLLFLEQYDPGCGTIQLDDVYARHLRLSSVRDVLSAGGVTVLELRLQLEEWRREVRRGLHCLLTTEEGGRLSQTISMFHRLATARLDLSNIN